MKIALLIIDMQKTFLDDKKENLGVARACEYINYVAKLLRAMDNYIVHVRDVEGADDINSEELQIISDVEIEISDIQITKEASNAFWNTELENILREKEVELVVVSGFAAENCVLFTYNGAIERGFKTVMLQNGIASEFNDTIVSINRDRNLISYPVIELLTK